ncbi:TPA: hypothetical protein LZ311_004056 [Enterobacter asburiae]|nr:hypothetical protein [Enterobacter asburiae]
MLVLAALPLLADVRLGAALRNGLSGQFRPGCGVEYGFSWFTPAVCLRFRFGVASKLPGDRQDMKRVLFHLRSEK